MANVHPLLYTTYLVYYVQCCVSFLSLLKVMEIPSF